MVSFKAVVACTDKFKGFSSLLPSVVPVADRAPKLNVMNEARVYFPHILVIPSSFTIKLEMSEVVMHTVTPSCMVLSMAITIFIFVDCDLNRLVVFN